MSDWYDRQRRPISVRRANELLGDRDYKVVARHEQDGHTVSTVWLGLDHNYGGGEPLIFETMIFGPDSMADLYCERYSTEAAAIVGHRRAVEHLQAEIRGARHE
ncbi:hypothetical protein [Actinomadura nitritigenes]|uniref:hypothetical protein n=1 Tax=Actinomadura nitritigenes TaxID=134602 RepID=UPI003D8D2BF4